MNWIYEGLLYPSVHVDNFLLLKSDELGLHTGFLLPDSDVIIDIKSLREKSYIKSVMRDRNKRPTKTYTEVRLQPLVCFAF